MNGAIYHGAIPGEVEIGHLRIDREGTIVEDRCAGPAVDRLVREAAITEPESVLARHTAGGLLGGEARHLGAALDQGCRVADRILTRVMDDLAYALSHAVQLLHPEVIVFGGGLSLIGEPARERLARALPKWIMEAFRPGPKVLLAELREDAVPVGALALAAQRLKH